jgi:hypothetical protein
MGFGIGAPITRIAAPEKAPGRGKFAVSIRLTAQLWQDYAGKSLERSTPRRSGEGHR